MVVMNLFVQWLIHQFLGVETKHFSRFGVDESCPALVVAYNNRDRRFICNVLTELKLVPQLFLRLNPQRCGIPQSFGKTLYFNNWGSRYFRHLSSTQLYRSAGERGNRLSNSSPKHRRERKGDRKKRQSSGAGKQQRIPERSIDLLGWAAESHRPTAKFRPMKRGHHHRPLQCRPPPRRLLMLLRM